MCGRSWTCAATARPRCAPSPRKRARWCASTRAPSAASMATACAAANGSRGSSARRSMKPSAPSSRRWTRSVCSIPATIIDPPRMDDGALFRFPPPGAAPYTVQPLRPVLDWSAWNVQNDPVTEVTTAPGSGGDPALASPRRSEMCNNNGHCRKFDAGTMCPSYRVTRDEQHPHPRPRQHTAPGAVGPARPGRLDQRGHARDDGPVRLLQGLQARMPDRRRHGEDEDRVPVALQGEARLHAQGPAGRASAGLCRCASAALPGWPTCATACRGGAGSARSCSGFPRKRSLPRWRSDTFWRARMILGCSPAARRRLHRGAGRKVAVLFVDTFNGNFESENALAAARVLKGRRLHAVSVAEGRRPALLRPHLSWPPAWWTRPRPRRAR